jgi:dCMP deaminase
MPGKYLNHRPDGRPTRDAAYFAMTTTLAAIGDCRRRRIGALIVSGDDPISWGVNGTTPGRPGCIEGKCERGTSDVAPYSPYTNCIAIHAEDNALRRAERLGRDVRGATMYVSAKPCADCSALIENAGIGRVLFDPSLIS